MEGKGRKGKKSRNTPYINSCVPPAFPRGSGRSPAAKRFDSLLSLNTATRVYLDYTKKHEARVVLTDVGTVIIRHQHGRGKLTNVKYCEDFPMGMTQVR